MISRFLFSVILVHFLFIGSAQIVFEEGYYINEQGVRMEELIKNMDWKDSPTSFDFKHLETAVEQKLHIEDVLEFGILNVSRYLRTTLDVNQISNVTNKLGFEKNPQYEEETIFLKTLVDGKLGLYELSRDNEIKYFIKRKDSSAEELIYIIYQNKENSVLQNKRYRQQLWLALQSDVIDQSMVKKIAYKKKPLVNLITKYNQAAKEDYYVFENKQQREKFNLNLRLGIRQTSLNLINSQSAIRNTDFGSQLNWSIGLEAEYILPFNRNKWSFIVEPTFQKFTGEMENVLLRTMSIDYTSIETPIGIRHYFFLNNSTSIFLNGSGIVDFVINGTIDSELGSVLEISPAVNYALGVGVKVLNKFSFEVRYFSNRDLLLDKGFWTTEYKNISLNLGYTLF